MIRRLFNMVRAIDQNAQAARNDEQTQVLAQRQVNFAFMEQGTVLAAQQGTATVSFQGTTVQADLATDEPLQAGMQVWILQADDKSFVILGSVK